MTKNQALARIAAIVCTLNEVDGSPESMLYMGACAMDLNDWTILREILLQAKFVTISGNYVRITDAGRAAAARVNAHIASRA